MTLLVQPILWSLAGLVALAASLSLYLAHRRKARRRPAALVLAGAVAFAALAVPAVAFVPPGHRGVVYRWGGGIDPRERGEGITFLVPWVETLRLMSVRTQKVYSAKIYSQSLDLQEITVVGSVNYHVRPDRAAEVYQSIGPSYRLTVVEPALYQRAKAAVGRIKAEDFAAQRTALAETVRRQLAAQLGGYGIAVEFVNVEDAIFDKAFVRAVKLKIIAEQEALTQRRLIEAERAKKVQVIVQAEAQAQSTIIKARQQAKANRVVAASITAALLRWQWLMVWNGTLPSTLAGTDLGILLGIPAADSTGEPTYPPYPMR